MSEKEPTKESMLATIDSVLGIALSSDSRKNIQAIRCLVENQANQLEVDEKTFNMANKMSYDAGYDKGYSEGWRDAKDKFDFDR